MSSEALLHNGSYIYPYFFSILSTIKMKFGKILMHLTCFWLNPGDWNLVPGPFIISLKWKYGEIWPFLIVDIYHF